MLLTIHAHKHGGKGNRTVLLCDGGYSLINNKITMQGIENTEAAQKSFLKRTLLPQNVLTVVQNTVLVSHYIYISYKDGDSFVSNFRS
jgi:hypothetical protein